MNGSDNRDESAIAGFAFLVGKPTPPLHMFFGTMAFQAVDFRSKSSRPRDRQTSRLMDSSGSTAASF